MKKLLLFTGALLLVGGGCLSENTTPVTLDVPESVVMGEDFEITVSIENDTNKDKFLHSIDIGNAYLYGVTVYDSEPAFSDYYELMFDEMMSYTLETTIPANTTGEVVFKARAYEPGVWIDGFDVCFGKGADCVYMHISTIVEEDGEEVLEDMMEEDTETTDEEDASLEE